MKDAVGRVGIGDEHVFGALHVAFGGEDGGGRQGHVRRDVAHARQPVERDLNILRLAGVMQRLQIGELGLRRLRLQFGGLAPFVQALRQVLEPVIRRRQQYVRQIFVGAFADHGREKRHRIGRIFVALVSGKQPTGVGRLPSDRRITGQGFQSVDRSGG